MKKKKKKKIYKKKLKKKKRSFTAKILEGVEVSATFWAIYSRYNGSHNCATREMNKESNVNTQQIENRNEWMVKAAHFTFFPPQKEAISGIHHQHKQNTNETKW